MSTLFWILGAILALGVLAVIIFIVYEKIQDQSRLRRMSAQVQRIQAMDRGEYPIKVTPEMQRQTAKKCIAILRKCKTREEIIKGFFKVSETDDFVARNALQVWKGLRDDPSLDAVRLRDEYIRQYEAFISSIRNV